MRFQPHLPEACNRIVCRSHMKVVLLKTGATQQCNCCNRHDLKWQGSCVEGSWRSQSIMPPKRISEKMSWNSNPISHPKSISPCFGQVTNPTCCITVLRSWKMQQPQRKAAASCDTAVKGTRSSTAIKGAAKVNARPVVIESCWNKSSTEHSHEFTRPTVCVCEPESSYNIIIPYIPTSQCIHQQPDPPPRLHPISRVGSIVAMTLPQGHTIGM